LKWKDHFSFKKTRNILFLFLFLFYLEIPAFIIDTFKYGSFKLINKRIIECVENFCSVFVDRKIEPNTGIIKLFILLLLLNKCYLLFDREFMILKMKSSYSLNF
jgi:hypothetical protein